MCTIVDMSSRRLLPGRSEGSHGERRVQRANLHNLQLTRDHCEDMPIAEYLTIFACRGVLNCQHVVAWMIRKVQEVAERTPTSIFVYRTCWVVQFRSFEGAGKSESGARRS